MSSLPRPSVSLLEQLRQRGLRLATAESCTTGRIAAAFGQIPGASSFLQGGVVAYATPLKTSLLGVSAELIAREHVVSIPVAEAMVRGVCHKLGADLGIASTGLAGPGGGEPGRPVGTVCLAVLWRRDTEELVRSATYLFAGDRESIILQATAQALELVEEILQAHP